MSTIWSDIALKHYGVTQLTQVTLHDIIELEHSKLNGSCYCVS